MTDYHPDRWVVIQGETSDGTYVLKVFGSWKGGFTTGDSWKLNSGVKSVEVSDGTILFHGFSGSTYVCHPGDYGTFLYTSGVLNKMIVEAEKEGAHFDILPEDTDWSQLKVMA